VVKLNAAPVPMGVVVAPQMEQVETHVDVSDIPLLLFMPAAVVVAGVLLVVVVSIKVAAQAAKLLHSMDTPQHSFHVVKQEFGDQFRKKYGEVNVNLSSRRYNQSTSILFCG
jgi:hypothetical protein